MGPGGSRKQRDHSHPRPSSSKSSYSCRRFVFAPRPKIIMSFFFHQLFVLSVSFLLSLCRCCQKTIKSTPPYPCCSSHCFFPAATVIAAPFSDRATLLYNNFLFIAGGFLCAVAVGSSGLFFGRFLGGMAVGCVRDLPRSIIYVFPSVYLKKKMV